MNADLIPRLRIAVENPDVTTIALGCYYREAMDAYDRDTRDLFERGVEFKASRANGRLEVKFPNGSRVLYYGGPRYTVEQWLRGRDAAHIDNFSTVAPEIVALCIRQAIS